jgi:phosphoglycolate phosphatase
MKHVVFDFDGTLADSLPVVIELAKELVPGFELSDEEIAKLRNMSARQVIKYSGIPYWKLLRLLVKGKKIFAGRVDEVQLFKGIPAVLKQLHQDGFQLSIVSSNTEDTIRQILAREDVEQYIGAIYGNLGLFNKSRAFKKVLRDQKTTRTDMVYVADEVRDIDSSKKSHIPIVSVTWGYNGKDILEHSSPTYLVDTPKQLLAILQKHRQDA